LFIEQSLKSGSAFVVCALTTRQPLNQVHDYVPVILHLGAALHDVALNDGGVAHEDA
jgi:hypothetical protein